jgi:chromosomal replication initiation ATPase DnaA
MWDLVKMRREILDEMRLDPDVAREAIRQVARVCEITEQLILSDDRHAPVCRARWAAIWLISKVCGYYTTEIAALFGRHHSAIIYAIQEVEARRKVRQQYREELDKLVAYLRDYQARKQG